MTGFLVAILSGVLMALQGVFNTGVTKQASLWTTAAFANLTGLIVCLCVWLYKDRTSFLKLMEVKPLYLLLGGTIGVFITCTVIVSMGKIGPAKATMFIVIAQLLTAYVIELFGWFQTEKQPFDLSKIIGMVIAIIGVIIFKWK